MTIQLVKRDIVSSLLLLLLLSNYYAMTNAFWTDKRLGRESYRTKTTAGAITSWRLLRVDQNNNNSINNIRRHGNQPLSSTTSMISSSTAVQAAARFKNFEQVLDTFHAEPVIIYFNTRRCGPCQLMKKEVESVRKMVGEEMKMFSIDTEKWPQVGSRFAVARLPCLVVFQEGEIKLRLEGVNKAEKVIQLVRAFQ